MVDGIIILVCLFDVMIKPAPSLEGSRRVGIGDGEKISRENQMSRASLS